MSEQLEPLALVTLVAAAVAAFMAGSLGGSESWPFGMTMAYVVAAVVVIFCASMLWVIVEGSPETNKEEGDTNV